MISKKSLAGFSTQYGLMQPLFMHEVMVELLSARQSNSLNLFLDLIKEIKNKLKDKAIKGLPQIADTGAYRCLKPLMEYVPKEIFSKPRKTSALLEEFVSDMAKADYTVERSIYDRTYNGFFFVTIPNIDCCRHFFNTKTSIYYDFDQKLLYCKKDLEMIDCILGDDRWLQLFLRYENLLFLFGNKGIYIYQDPMFEMINPQVKLEERMNFFYGPELLSLEPDVIDAVKGTVLPLNNVKPIPFGVDVDSVELCIFDQDLKRTITNRTYSEIHKLKDEQGKPVTYTNVYLQPKEALFSEALLTTTKGLTFSIPCSFLNENSVKLSVTHDGQLNLYVKEGKLIFFQQPQLVSIQVKDRRDIVDEDPNSRSLFDFPLSSMRLIDTVDKYGDILAARSRAPAKNKGISTEWLKVLTQCSKRGSVPVLTNGDVLLSFPNIFSIVDTSTHYLTTAAQTENNLIHAYVKWAFVIHVFDTLQKGIDLQQSGSSEFANRFSLLTDELKERLISFADLAVRNVEEWQKDKQDEPIEILLQEIGKHKSSLTENVATTDESLRNKVVNQLKSKGMGSSLYPLANYLNGSLIFVGGRSLTAAKDVPNRYATFKGRSIHELTYLRLPVCWLSQTFKKQAGLKEDVASIFFYVTYTDAERAVKIFYTTCKGAEIYVGSFPLKQDCYLSEDFLKETFDTFLDSNTFTKLEFADTSEAKSKDVIQIKNKAEASDKHAIAWDTIVVDGAKTAKELLIKEKNRGNFTY